MDKNELAAARKVTYLAIKDAIKKRAMPMREGKMAVNSSIPSLKVD
ncbi:hypothetical protein [uncultured Sneathiella sp.]|jgi:hypothetical protein|tara:strand:+ start:52241 stop:52378 length:138 start_codon:yes stop_codon:yes gene_type:complete